MRVQVYDGGVKLWLSPADTTEWANRPSKRWPGSQLEGHRLFADFDRSGLVDMAVDNGRGHQDIDSNEFNAITADYLRDRLPKDHLAYFVTVGQFEKES